MVSDDSDIAEEEVIAYTWGQVRLMVTIVCPHTPCLTALMNRHNADDCRGSTIDDRHDALY